MTDVTITFPDGKQRQVQAGTTGLEIAKSISPSLAKRTVAMQLNGALADLADPINQDASINFVSRTDPAALELIRHDAAHVLAEAVQSIWPGTQVTIGPVIDNGFYYDFAKQQPFEPEDIPKIEKRMGEIIAKNAPFTKEVWSRNKAKEFFKDKGEYFKVELVDAIPEDQDLKIYKQGEWLDLCRGPHMTSTGQVGKAFKLMKFAGAYWRGDSTKPQLQRIYGTAFATEDELKAYLHQLEEAEKRDHRKLGREMDLFHFQEEAPGSVFWHPKGWTLFQTLIAYMRRQQARAGYTEVNTPDMMEKHFWELSGHWENYGENMFTTVLPDERVFCCKPMNCPGHVQIYKNGLKSYRDLPLRIAEFGKVHRYEPSGALHGMLRVRHFTQDDAHIFLTEHQIMEECLKINDLILSIYKDFGFENIVIKLSLRPEKRVGSDELWDKAEKALSDVLDEVKRRSNDQIKTEIQPGEGAFYGPKLEYVLRDAIGRDWQCGTTQVDFNLAGRLGAFYIDEKSEKNSGNDPPRDLRLARTLHRHPHRELRRPFSAVARAAADRRRADRFRRQRLCRPRCREGEGAGPARRNGPSQRKDQPQSPRAFADEGAGDPRGRKARGGREEGLGPPPRVSGPDCTWSRRGVNGACPRSGASRSAVGCRRKSVARSRVTRSCFSSAVSALIP